MSLYNYMSTKTNGDSLKNLNNSKIPHENRGNQLINEFTKGSIEGEFPEGTRGIDAEKVQHKTDAPKHLNFGFTPKSNSGNQAFEFCFMDMAGEDLIKIDFDNNMQLPESIRTYIEDLDKNNLRFIYIIDPAEATATREKQNKVFDAFINLVDQNDKTEVPVLVVISKWDTVDNYTNSKEFLQKKYKKVWGVANHEIRNFSFMEFSIGKVENSKIIEYDSSFPERLFKWIYKQHTGKDFQNDIVKGTKKSGWFKEFINKYF